MNNNIYILGISAYYHDSAASLICNGEIIAAVQEERFTRIKGDSRFPQKAIQYCLNEAGINVARIDYVVYYESQYIKFDRLMETYSAAWPKAVQLFNDSFPLWADKQLNISNLIKSELGQDFKGQIYNTDHHLSHAASAFFPSPYKESAILTLDAVGEWSTSTIGTGEGNKINLISEMRFPQSIGMLYSAFTYYTGFKVNSGEYKLMGLAPYGKPVYADIIRDKVLKIFEDGSIWMDMDYFSYVEGLTMTSEKFHDLFEGPPRNPENLITQKEMDLAASIQSITEEIVLKAANHTYKLTGKENLVMAGGVALNCVANGKLLREGPFKNIWIQPAAGDSGGSLGAALLMWHHFLDKEREIDTDDSQKGSFLGPSFTHNQVKVYLDSVGAVYNSFDSEEKLLNVVSDQLKSEKIIGWFYGRMEFGPRALGGRSIIGDARSTKMQQIMNLKIKYRESFRPFAPCVLLDHVHEYFDFKEGEESPYMLFVAPVKEEQRRELSDEEIELMNDSDLRKRVSVPRSSIPAITHVDYSARIQTVSEDRNGRFYRLMKNFYDKTGCPVIVNTSFNIRGEPIVCSPENAYKCFMATEMDCLVIDNYFLRKEDQPSGLLPELKYHIESIALD
ncbi:carbamoyltransferase [soil metagenome]